MTVFLIAYGLSVIVATYLASRYLHPRVAGIALIWPFLVALSPIYFAMCLGYNHRRAEFNSER